MSEYIKIQYYSSPLGEMILGDFNGELCLADWRYRKMRKVIDDRIKKILSAEYIEEKTEIIEKAILQFQEYFKGKRTEFDIPLLLAGSDFQRSVWSELLKIPYGKTDSYMGLSVKLGNKNAVRAVASANGANAISIIVPCHRIIGYNGSLVGYAGGLNAKRKLLELESSGSVSTQMSLF